MNKWLKNKLQHWLGIPVLFVELNKAFNRIERLENSTRLGKRAMRYDEVNRARKRRYKRRA